MRTRTRTISITALAITSVIGLSACTPATDSPEPTATRTVTAAPVNPANESGWNADEQAMIDAYEYDFYPLTPSEEADLIALTYSVCDTLDAGASVEEVITIGVESGVDPFESGYIVGISIAGVCPVYTADAEAFINQYS